MIEVILHTKNVFKDRESYLEWKRAMIASGSIVDFDALENKGEYYISSGDVVDGSITMYKFEDKS